jgi:hypothetical protein
LITNDQELKVTQERIDQFQQWLIQIRRTARPKEFDGVTSGYRLETDRMQAKSWTISSAQPKRLQPNRLPKAERSPFSDFCFQHFSISVFQLLLGSFSFSAFQPFRISAFSLYPLAFAFGLSTINS